MNGPITDRSASNSDLLEMNRRMRRVRTFEGRVGNLYAWRKLRVPSPLPIGQKSAAVGVCATLRDGDTVTSHQSIFPSHGADPNRMMAQAARRA
ncbi:MAG: hypothetical protein HLUCCA08_00530 [Rhodobacteraceae bacterium HLUCCA08]|nr:MAG: hypothetical protein HLUCCA08_00530 [Rhodobacteraceae bacterium HLUCCA08]